MGRYKTIGIGLKNKYIIVILLYAWAYSLSAQQWDWWPLAINDTTLYADTILYQAYISALGSSGREVPFLLRANHHGGGRHYGDTLTTGFFFSSIQRYSPDTDKWEYIGNMPYEAENMIAIGLHDQVFIGLGETPDGKIQNNWYRIEE